MNKSLKIFRLLALPLGLAWWAAAQSYSLQNATITGGGGTSTGGVYAVSGSIGQPLVGGMLTGGVYSVEGGFWSLVVVVPTPGAPRLELSRTPTSFTLSWDVGATGFILQTTTALDGLVPWSEVSGVVGNRITVAVDSQVRFYRLLKK